MQESLSPHCFPMELFIFATKLLAALEQLGPPKILNPWAMATDNFLTATVILAHPPFMESWRATLEVGLIFGAPVSFPSASPALALDGNLHKNIKFPLYKLIHIWKTSAFPWKKSFMSTMAPLYSLLSSSS